MTELIDDQLDPDVQHSSITHRYLDYIHHLATPLITFQLNDTTY